MENRQFVNEICNFLFVFENGGDGALHSTDLAFGIKDVNRRFCPKADGVSFVIPVAGRQAVEQIFTIVFLDGLEFGGLFVTERRHLKE